jgi:hypothetical protein
MQTGNSNAHQSDAYQTMTEERASHRSIPAARRLAARLQQELARPGLWWALILTTFAIRAIHAMTMQLHNDVGALLHLTGRWLDGATLYRQIIDPNTLMTYLIYAPAVWLGRLLGISNIVVLEVAMLLLATGSFLVCKQLLDRLLREQSVMLRGTLMVVLAYLVFFPIGELWQREHIMLLLVLPYLLTAALRVKGERIGRWAGMAIGVTAGIGTAIKPYYMPVWGCIEVYLLVMCGRRSLLRVVRLVIASVVSVFWVAVLVFFPGYVDVIRMAMDTYRAYYTPYSDLLANNATFSWLLAVVTAILFRLPKEQARVRGVFLVAATAYLAVALYAHTSWAYHFYPALVIGRLCIFLNLVLFAERLQFRGRSMRYLREWGAVVVVAGVMLVSGVRLLDTIIHPQSEWPLIGLLKSYSGRSVAAISCSIRPLFPAVNYADTHLVSRFAYLWTLPGCYVDSRVPPGRPFPYHPIERMGATERYLFDGYISDLAASQPDVILIDRSKFKDGFARTSFDFLEYFSRDRRFATLVANYDSVAMVDEYLVLERQGAISSRN